MKFILSLIFLSTISCFAKSEEIMPGPWYNIVSDSESADVPKGKCKVFGKAMADTDEVYGAKVSNLTGTHQTLTDEEGNFELLIPSTDTAIFFYHKDYQEVVIWNYNFQDQHAVEIAFHTWPAPTGLEVEEKPVIYAYSNMPQEVEISLERANQITHSYPVYEQSWKFEAHSYEGLNSPDKPPYLFYEAETEKLDFDYAAGVAKGDFIESEEVIDYLEGKLSLLGLNDIESAHFITYWGPRLQAKKYAFIQFLVDEECDEAIGELVIEPKPDHIRRVYILFQTTDLPIQFHENWEEGDSDKAAGKFQRDGLTIIEWGGTELKRLPSD